MDLPSFHSIQFGALPIGCRDSIISRSRLARLARSEIRSIGNSFRRFQSMQPELTAYPRLCSWSPLSGFANCPTYTNHRQGPDQADSPGKRRVYPTSVLRGRIGRSAEFNHGDLCSVSVSRLCNGREQA